VHLPVLLAKLKIALFYTLFKHSFHKETPNFFLHGTNDTANYIAQRIAH